MYHIFVYIIAILYLNMIHVYCSDSDINNGLRIAVGSCNNHKREGIWDIVSHHKPQKMILLGDNMYADKRTGFTTGFGVFEEANHTELGAEYDLFGEDESYQDLLLEIGGLSNVYAIYDDHDYGINNGGADYQYKQQSRDEFNKFFQVDYSHSHRKTLEDGVYSSHIVEELVDGVVLRIKVIMLDVRYNRIMQPSESCDLLGDEQWRWLQGELDSSIYNHNSTHTNTDTPITVCDDVQSNGVCVNATDTTDTPVDLILIGSGTQILPQGKMIEETWDKDCVPNRERLLDMLSDTIEQSILTNTAGTSPNGISTGVSDNHINILLLSGDVHGAEISQARCNIHKGLPMYPLVEYTSSGFTHSFTHHTPMKTLSNTTKSTQSEPHERVRSLETPVLSKGRFGEWIYDLYQTVTPTHHRQHKSNDHYSQPHFSMLYITPNTTPDTSNSNTNSIGIGHVYKQVHIEFRVINASNEVVMTHRVDYLAQTQAQAQANSSADAHSLSFMNPVNRCTLIRGDVPLYKIIWTRFATAMWIMTCFLLPFLTIVWLICASIYYICVGSELKRRHSILVKNRNKLMKTE